MTTPAADRPDLPDGYGLPDSLDGLRPWTDVEERLRNAETVWLATVRPDGRPHVVPRWGAWVEGRWFYDGAPTTVHAQNLRADGRCVLHLESGTDVVILEGTSAPASPLDPALAERIRAEMTRKYAASGYSPEPGAWDGPDAGGLCVFTPAKGLTWSAFPNDATRYRFG